MPRGGRRPGAGRRPKALSAHVLEGTFRPARHAARAAAAATMPPTPDWQPADAERAALGPVAVTWLDAALGLYQLDSLDGLRLMLALRTLTRVEGLEAAIDAAGVAKGSTPHALLLALAREQKTFSAQWAALEFWKAAKS